MHLAQSNAQLKDILGPRAAVGGCVLVPTMGALHAGHEALIRQGVALARERSLAGGCVVSIFVNPTQFNEKADFDRYPRTLEADAEICRRAGASVVWAPPVEDIYPPANPPPVPPLPDVAVKPCLEDAFRPGHFAGVCQVVKRLFDIVHPAMAVFGEKDWQQLAVIRAMVAERGLSSPRVNIVSALTIREPDGLAMSSRNRFLSPADRPRALAISRALRESNTGRTPAEAESAMRRALANANIDPEYAVIRDAATLLPVTNPHAAARALIAARVGGVRLIDNAPWTGSPE